MSKFEQEYCRLDCTNKLGEGCALPTRLDQVLNVGRGVSDSVCASLLGVYKPTLVGATEVDFYQQTAACAEQRIAAGESTLAELPDATVLSLPEVRRS